MNIPFIDLRRTEHQFHQALMEKFYSITLGAQFIKGSEVSTLEARLRTELQVEHAVTCVNGTDAIQLALRVVDVSEAIVNVGAKPATVDADISDGGVSFDAFANAIERIKPKAALGIHIYGCVVYG